MPSSKVPLFAISTAVNDVMQSLTVTAEPLTSWSDLHENAMWRELVACILGSRVRYTTAFAAVNRLADAHLLAPPEDCVDFSDYQHAIETVLASSSSPYPFSRSKANQIRGAAEHVYARGQGIRGLLSCSNESRGVRRSLAKSVPGLGPKQASLFLRNIGYADDLAVLDTHVLTYMDWFQLTDERALSVPSLEQYELLEDAFIRHARSLGHALDRFDIAVWIVVRTARKELEYGLGDTCVGRL